MTKRFHSAALAAIVALSLLVPNAPNLSAQEPSDPVAALSAAIVAACRDNEAQFLNYFAADNAAAFRALPA